MSAVVVLAVLLTIALVALVLSRRSDDTVATSTSPTATPSTTTPATNRTPGTATPGAPSSPTPTDPNPNAPPTTAAPAGSGLPTGPAPTAAQVQAEVDQLTAFVQLQRGVAFTTAVAVQVLPTTDFETALRAALEPDKPIIERRGQLLQAMGAIANGIDVPDARTTIIVGETVAFYDPAAKKLLVRAIPITPLTRAQLVRELTRALDDQIANLVRPDYATAGDEIAFTFAAVIDGDASRITQAYLATLASADRTEHDRLVSQAQAVSRPAGISSVFISLVDGPSTLGFTFDQQLLLRADVARLETALKDPPHASSGVLHPERYLAGEVPLAVPTPQAEGQEVGEGVFGEYLTSIVLGTSVTADDAARAADGWKGDAYVLWKGDGGGLCVRIRYEMSAAAETKELVDAFTTWAQQHGGVQVQGQQRGNTLEITSCAGGGGGRSPL